MPILRWMTVIWPGWPRLWLLGEWSALALACGFAVLLNLAVVSTWVWTELLGTPLLVVAWIGTFSFWSVSFVAAVLQMPALLRVGSADLAADLFRAAQGEYLKGNWFEAELALNRLLEHQPGDADGHFLLATLLRRTGHFAEARERLRQLATLDGAAKWQLEMAREGQLLAGVETTAQNVRLERGGECGLPSAA